MNKMNPVLIEISHENQMKNLSCLGIEQLVGMFMHRTIWFEALYTSMICKQKGFGNFFFKRKGVEREKSLPQLSRDGGISSVSQIHIMFSMFQK